MFLTEVVMEAFRKDLIFQMNACCACLFKKAYRPQKVCGFAETSSNIDHHWNIHNTGDAASRLNHVLEAEIWLHESGLISEGATGQVKSQKTQRFGNFCGERIENSGSCNDSRLGDQFAQNGSHAFWLSRSRSRRRRERLGRSA